MNAIAQLQVAASPTLAAIMADKSPPADRARIMAGQLDGMLIAGDFERLNHDQRMSLRALVFGLDMLAEAIDAMPKSPPVVKRRRWWAGWWA